nr:hypothetical protein [Tanacetum cinerariifolium]GEZ46256.1 hypothetical protein [Tanacetum cinerariifolium]
MMSALEESRGINLGWVIFDYLCKHALRLKENSLICEGEIDLENYTLLGSTSLPPLPKVAREQRDSMLMRNNYMLKHSMPILYHLADQANYAYPTYEPSNIPPYPYPYVPYPYPYTHYPDMGFRGTSIVPSSGYEIKGSSRAIQNDDDASMSECRVHMDDAIENEKD